MNTKLSLIVSIGVIGLLRSAALAADNRFDGIWVGTETVMGQEFRGGLHSKSYGQSTPAEIAIAQNGTLLAVVDGYGKGRYLDIRQVGNTIVFHAGQRIGQLTLSPDGQTLTEKGVVPGFAIVNYAQREGALSGHTRTIQAKGTGEVIGTFHRKK